jgi:hypothetical protein
MLRTEFPFRLPHGYVDDTGTVHQEGTMRLATAEDEIAPLRDPRVQSNPAYLVVVLLSRVITRLGELPSVNPRVVNGLFAGDLAYLESLYGEVNDTGRRLVGVTCPHCGTDFEMDLGPPGE